MAEVRHTQGLRMNPRLREVEVDTLGDTLRSVTLKFDAGSGPELLSVRLNVDEVHRLLDALEPHLL